MSHTFTVTRIADDPEGDSDDPQYTTDGPCDRSCLVWYPCDFANCDADDEGEFHGVEHMVIGSIEEFCVQSQECALTYAFQTENPEWQMTALGTYAVDVTWDGDSWYADLTLKEPTNV